MVDRFSLFISAVISSSGSPSSHLHFHLLSDRTQLGVKWLTLGVAGGFLLALLRYTD